jgi:outer membrane cobalamin receptor
VSAEQVDQVKQDDSYSSYELGATTHFNDIELELAFSKGIRTPTLFELYGDRGAFKGNANLAPEHSNTFMLASSYNNNALNITSSLYRTKQENAIVAIFNSTGTGSYTNVSDATLNGLELQIDYRFNSAWSTQLQTNVIDSQTHSEFVAFDDKKLPGIYHQQYSVSLDYQLNEAWRLSLDTHIDKELYFNRTNRFTNTQAKGNGTPSNREISDFSVTWQNSQQTLSLQVNNIFNNDYLDLANRPAQGRSFQVKYSIKGL